MLIKIKEPIDTEITGFDEKIDIFGRKAIGESLANLFDSTEENLIIGLNGQWGEGKSTFAKMFSAYLSKERSVPSIYFDAFENDYQRDPFLALAGAIQELIEDQPLELKKEFRISAIRASKAIFRGALRVGIKTITAGILDDTILEDLNTAGDVSDEISQHVDKALADKLDETKSDKNALISFKATLENLVNKLGEGKPLILIVDELDRCRPDFCLEFIEQIKHLFTVKNLKFLLVTNKKQIYASLQKRYGLQIDPHIYLQKFIDLWIELPRIEDQYASHTEKYLQHLLKSMSTSDEEEIKNKLTIMLLKDLFIAHKTSYRGMQKTLSYLSIFQNATGNKQYLDYYQIALAIVCFSSSESPNLVNMITKRHPSKDIINALFPEKIASRNDWCYEFTSKFIEYFTATEERQRQMIKDREFESENRREIPSNTFHKIQDTLNLFSS